MPETWDRLKDRIRGVFGREEWHPQQSNRAPERPAWSDYKNELTDAAKADALAHRTPEDQARIGAVWREISKDVTVEPDTAWYEAVAQVQHEDNLQDGILERDSRYNYNPAREPEHDNEWGRNCDDLIVKLREYSSSLGEEVTHAEQLIATRIATEIEEQPWIPNRALNLSQKYDTGDFRSAAQRHAKAIENLEPLIREAEGLGYRIDRGVAIPARLQQVERIAPLVEAKRVVNHGLAHSIGGGMSI